MSATVVSVLTVLRNDRSTPGFDRMKDSKIGANRCTKAWVAAATRTRPTGAFSRPSTRSLRLWASSRIRIACSSTACPTWESFTPRLARMKIGSPSSISSDLIWWLTADWVRFSRSAARVKLRVSATTRNVRSCDSSMDSPLSGRPRRGRSRPGSSFLLMSDSTTINRDDRSSVAEHLRGRDRDHRDQGVRAGVAVTQAGVGDVVELDAQPRPVREAPTHLEARAELEGIAQVLAAAFVVVAGGEARTEHQPVPEGQGERETP